MTACFSSLLHIPERKIQAQQISVITRVCIIVCPVHATGRQLSSACHGSPAVQCMPRPASCPVHAMTRQLSSACHGSPTTGPPAVQCFSRPPATARQLSSAFHIPPAVESIPYMEWTSCRALHSPPVHSRLDPACRRRSNCEVTGHTGSFLSLLTETTQND